MIAWLQSCQNNYALFQVSTEVGFYNQDEYQVFENTGNVTYNTTYEDLLNVIPEQSYPLSKYASSECNNALCTVNQVINIKTYPRISSISKFNDAITDRLFTCTVKVKPPFDNPDDDDDDTPTDPTKALDKLYRNVDPSRMFPNGVKDETNWATEAGQTAKEQIENTANLIQTSEDLIDYRITLNPEQIKAIKQYNANHGGYINEVVRCSDKIDDSHYFNCTSEFMDALRGRNDNYPSGTLGDLSSEYTGTNRYHQINGD